MGSRSIVLVLLAGSFWLVPPQAAVAVPHPHPEPPSGLTVRGFVRGTLGRDSDVRFALTATHPRGFHHLSSLRADLVLHGESIQDITFLVDDRLLAVGSRPPVPIGPAAPSTVPGSFLSVDASRTRLIRSTFSVRVELRLAARTRIPGDAVFRMTVTDDEGGSATSLRRPRLDAGLLSWGTLVVAVALALVVGGLTGTTLSARRHRQRQPSIWEILERRLKEENARPPPAGVSAAGGGIA